MADEAGVLTVFTTCYTTALDESWGRGGDSEEGEDFAFAKLRYVTSLLLFVQRRRRSQLFFSQHFSIRGNNSYLHWSRKTPSFLGCIAGDF